MAINEVQWNQCTRDLAVSLMKCTPHHVCCESCKMHLDTLRKYLCGGDSDPSSNLFCPRGHHKSCAFYAAQNQLQAEQVFSEIFCVRPGSGTYFVLSSPCGLTTWPKHVAWPRDLTIWWRFWIWWVRDVCSECTECRDKHIWRWPQPKLYFTLTQDGKFALQDWAGGGLVRECCPG